MDGLMDSNDNKCHQEQLYTLNVPEPGSLWDGRIHKAQRTLLGSSNCARYFPSNVPSASPIHPRRHLVLVSTEEN